MTHTTDLYYEARNRIAELEAELAKAKATTNLIQVDYNSCKKYRDIQTAEIETQLTIIRDQQTTIDWLEKQVEERFNAGLSRAAEMVAEISNESAKEGYEGFANRVNQIADAIRREIEK